MKNMIIAGALFASAASAQWMNVQGAYKPKDNVPTTRIEAGAKLGRLNLYEFTDIEGAPAKRFPKNVYAEARASLNAWKGIGPAAEYNGGTDYADTLRLGVAYTPKLHDKNFTVLKAFPYETTGKKGAQVSVFSSQTMGRLTPSVLLDYNTKSGTTYAELELECRVGKRWSVYAQERGFGTPTRPGLQPVVGIKFRP